MRLFVVFLSFLMIAAVSASAQTTKSPSAPPTTLKAQAVIKNRYVKTQQLSADGKLLLVQTIGKLRLFDTIEGGQIKEFWTSSKVKRAALMPDGSAYIVSRKQDDKQWQLVAYNVADNSVRWSVDVSRSKVADILRVSPSGRLLATGRKYGGHVITLVDPHKGRMIDQIAFGRKVSSFALSPDDQCLAVIAGPDLFIVDTKTRRLRRRIDRHGDFWNQIAFEEGCERVRIEGYSRKSSLVYWDSKLFETATGRLLNKKEKPGKKRDEMHLAAGGVHVRFKILRESKSPFKRDDGQLRLVEGKSGRTLALLPPSERPEGISATPDGQTIAVTYEISNNYETHIFYLKPGKKKRRDKRPWLAAGLGHRASIRTMVLSPDNKLLATGAKDGTWVWDLKSRRAIGLLPPDDSLNGLLFSPDGKRLLINSSNNSSFYALAKKLSPREKRAPDFREMTTASLITNKKDRLIRCSRTWACNIVDLATNKILPLKSGRYRFSADWSPDTASASGFWVEDIAISPDDRFLFLATGKPGPKLFSGSGTILVYDLVAQKHMARLQGHENTVRALALTKDGRVLISVGDDGKLLRWDLPIDPSKLQRPKLLFQAGKDIDAAKNLDEFARASRKKLKDVAMMPDNHHVIVGGYDGSARLINIDSGKLVRAFNLPPMLSRFDDIDRLVISDNGRRLITAHSKKTFRGAQSHIQIWDVETGKPLDQLSSGTASIESLAFARNGNRLLLNDRNDKRAWLWELDTGRVSRKFTAGKYRTKGGYRFLGENVFSGQTGKFHCWSRGTGRLTREISGSIQRIEISDDRKTSVLITSEVRSNGLIRVIDSDNCSERANYQLPVMYYNLKSVMLSHDGTKLLLRDEKKLFLVDTNNGRELWRTDMPNNTGFSHAWDFFFTGGPDLVALPKSTYHEHKVFVFDLANGQMINRIEEKDWLYVAAKDRANGKVLLLRHRVQLSKNQRIEIVEPRTGKVSQSVAMESRVKKVMVLPGGKRILIFDHAGFIIWDLQKQSITRRRSIDVKISSKNTSASLSADGTLLAVLEVKGVVSLWRMSNARKLAELITNEDGGWTVVDPDGRYDSYNPGENDNLSWILPDQPLTPVPLELFYRDYYEPRLLPRLIAGGTLPAVKPLMSLNRVRPRVAITKVEQMPGGPDRLSVSLTVQEQVDQSKKSGAQDLKLFRDGRLVASFPEQGGAIALTNGKFEITLDNIAIPRIGKKEQLHFSAHAFNTDGIKSETVRYVWKVPQAGDKTRRKRRAYIIAIGVNAYENSAWDLDYAAQDAKATAELLEKDLANSPVGFDEIIAVNLVSRAERQDGERHLTKNLALKKHIRTVIDLLAGRPVTKEMMAQIPQGHRLQRVRPDDLVYFSFSGHGLARANGSFYLFPHDLGAGKTRRVDEALLKQAISSRELSAWLRPVDAGEFIMVIDACNSAASIEGAGFKPGPMGSRDLGQLAYDKGMRVLAASQSQAVALESDVLRHGALTYALLREGLERAKADRQPRDKSITFGEFLHYGVSRVPTLYSDLRKGLVKPAGRAAISLSLSESQVAFETVQQPSLFDFRGDKKEFVLKRLIP